VSDEARGLLRLTGAQRIWFLQQTITADVDDMPDGTWRESAFLTPKGKLLAHFRVGVLGDDVWLDIDPPADTLADWLIKYRFRTKVEIEDRSGMVRTFIGPAASKLAGAGKLARIGHAVVFGDRLGNVPCVVVHGEAEIDLEDADPAELERARIEAGVARFGVDYTTDHLPQEAGLTSVVPVDKGCYVGQETVARIHFRGHINRSVRPLIFDGDASVGDALLLDGERVGAITSTAGRWGIGMVRVEPPEGTRVQIEGGGVATLGPLPEGTKVKTSSEGTRVPHRRSRRRTRSGACAPHLRRRPAARRGSRAPSPSRC
jgi:folate-binding protein YgfZ